MSANSIRRSDDNLENRYAKIADKLNKTASATDKPKFYEYGQSVTYQENDQSKLPVFTTNYINLSDLNYNKYNEDMKKIASKKEVQEDEFSQRAMQRRIFAGMEDFNFEDDSFSDEDALIDVQDEEIGCPKCQSFNLDVISPEESLSTVFQCNDCGNKFQDQDEPDMIEDSIAKDLPFPFNGSEEKSIFGNEANILGSIQSMLPTVTAKPNQKMNKMSSNIISGLINSLSIDAHNKQWLNAQVENGIINPDIFMRNIKSFLK